MASNSEIEKLQRRWDENPLGLTFAPLAEAYRKAGDPARALELLELGLTQHPNYVPAHIVRGRCHLDTGTDGEAELAFLRVTELDSENVIALKGLAELSERAGRLPEAIQRLQTLLDVDRNNEEARGQLDRVKDLLTDQASAPAAAAAPEPAPKQAAGPSPAPTPPPPPALVFDTPPAAAPAAHTPELPSILEPPPMPLPEPIEAFEPTVLGEIEGDIELDIHTELTPGTDAEFQIPNDSESLRPSGERFADIVLGTEPPEHQLPVAGLDSVDAFLGDDYAALLAYRHEPTDAADSTHTVDSIETMESSLAREAEEPEGHVPGFIPVGGDVGVTSVDVLPPPPPAPFEHQSFLPPPPEPEAAEPMAAAEPEPIRDQEPEPFREPEPQPEPEPVVAAWHWAAPVTEAEPVEEALPTAPVAEQESAAAESEPAVADEEPELVVTETMAEIFLRQGHRELALAVYAQLALREPGNQRIAEALARLTPEEPPAPAPAPVAPAQFAASDTGGRSVAQLFGSLLSAARPTPAPAIHPPAFEPPRRANGEPTRPAQESLSLSSVFGEDGAPGGLSGAPAEGPASEPSFDEFFAPATGPSSEADLPHAPGSEPDAMPAQVPEDLEQFNAWLRGLKR